MIFHFVKRVNECLSLLRVGQIAVKIRTGDAKHLAVLVLIPPYSRLDVGEHRPEPAVAAGADKKAGKAPRRSAHGKRLCEIGQAEHDPVLEQRQL